MLKQRDTFKLTDTLELIDGRAVQNDQKCNVLMKLILHPNIIYIMYITRKHI